MTIDNRQQLLGTINAQITLNGTGAITGPILNNVLDTMVSSALFYTGAWSQYTSYAPLDVVIYANNSYVAVSANVNVTPTSNAAIWTPLVSSSTSVGGVSGSVQYNNGSGGFTGASNFTFNGTALSVPALALTTALPVTSGGTGLTTLSGANKALYSTSSSTMTAGTLPVTAGGTGVTSLTANNVILGNGTSALQVVAPGASGNVLTSDGTTWTSAATTGGLLNVQTFTSSGTWTKPAGFGANSQVHIQCWAGGGSGAKINNYGMGGGGGGYNDRWLTLSSMGSTETITVGAGGAASTTNSGNQGGNTTAGSWVTAYGGAGASASYQSGGGGGGQLSAGSISTPGGPLFSVFNVSDYSTYNKIVYVGSGGDGLNVQTLAQDAYIHGGGGGGNSNVSLPGGKSVWGGGGGGSAPSGTGGASSFGGAGGAGGNTTNGVSGSQPGGGGGGTATGTQSGAGGAGQVIITVFPG